MAERQTKKQITFDLRQKDLKEHYPRPKYSVNPFYYKNAYRDIKRFMKRNGFVWRQGSVYVSKERLTKFEVAGLVRKIARELPWLVSCVREFDVTNISARQHSLVDLLREESRRQNKLVGTLDIIEEDALPRATKKTSFERQVERARDIQERQLRLDSESRQYYRISR